MSAEPWHRTWRTGTALSGMKQWCHVCFKAVAYAGSISWLENQIHLHTSKNAVPLGATSAYLNRFLLVTAVIQLYTAILHHRTRNFSFTIFLLYALNTRMTLRWFFKSYALLELAEVAVPGKCSKKLSTLQQTTGFNDLAVQADTA